MDTKEKIKVMQAYEDGKNIQMKTIGSDLWQDCNEIPSWDWLYCGYRIKPETEYRPYKDTAEMIEDFKKRFNVNVPDYSMPLIWVQLGATKYKYLINLFEAIHVGTKDGRVHLDSLFYNYTYLDGSPVGKLEEEK